MTQAFEHRTFFTRLHHFVLASDALIVAPGGVGTVLETMMVWQLLQVGHLRDVPLILVGRMWPGLVEWARTTMLSFDPPLVNPEDMSIPHWCDADEAIALVRHRHRNGPPRVAETNSSHRWDVPVGGVSSRILQIFLENKT